MAYDVKPWKSYRKNADFIEITIRDPSKKKIDFLRASNNKDFQTCLGILRKYGFNVDEKEKFKKGKDFLKSDFKW